MSNTDRPRLNFARELPIRLRNSASDTADGTNSAIVARKSRLACSRALARLYSCTWCLSPPSRNDMPSMNSVLVTIAPAIDAFTSVYCPACSAVSAMTSSVRFPSVALSRPPTVSPVLAATDSVAWLSSPASGTIASTDSTKSSVWASGLMICATNSTGTKASNQSKGFWRISLSNGFMVPRRFFKPAIALARCTLAVDACRPAAGVPGWVVLKPSRASSRRQVIAQRYEHTIKRRRPASIRLPTRGAPAFACSIRILTRADPGAVFILITTAVVSAVIAVRSSCNRSSRCTVRGSSINASANRRARYRATGYRTISIAASCNSISPAGNADTTSSMNCAATEMSAASVKASTAIATTTPTRRCVMG